MRVQQGRVRHRVRGRRRLEENRARVARSPRLQVRRHQVSHAGVENSGKHREAASSCSWTTRCTWLRCSDVYLSVALRDCVKVELKDAWGGVRVQATGRARQDRHPCRNVQVGGGKSLNQAGFVVLPAQKQAWLTKTRQAALDAGGFSIVEGRAPTSGVGDRAYHQARESNYLYS